MPIPPEAGFMLVVWAWATYKLVLIPILDEYRAPNFYCRVLERVKP
jgi:hypothetical protein